MGIRDIGEFKSYAIERFRGILDLTVKSSLSTRSPIPKWAADKVREAWNVSLISEAFATPAPGTAPCDREPASDGRG
jgi:hypothetical protein